jgi:hypothetical protein
MVLDEFGLHIALLYRRDVFAIPLDKDFNKGKKGMPFIGSLFFGTTKSDHQLLCGGYEGQISRPVWSVSCICAI